MSMVESMHTMDPMGSTGTPMHHGNMPHTMQPGSSHDHGGSMTRVPHDMNMSHGMNHQMNGQGHMSGHSMHSMYFSFNLPVRVLFFEWNIVTQQQLAASCVGIFLVSLLYEGLKVFRQYLLSRAKRNLSAYNVRGSDSELKFKNGSNSNLARIFNGWHILQSLLHIIQTTLGMLLMLVYMTFNVWLAISVSLGSGFGYFFFAWLIPTTPDFGDHCQ